MGSTFTASAIPALEGRTFIVTGGNTGIGARRAVARSGARGGAWHECMHACTAQGGLQAARCHINPGG